MIQVRNATGGTIESAGNDASARAPSPPPSAKLPTMLASRRTRQPVANAPGPVAAGGRRRV
jgi:hypothetical protein